METYFYDAMICPKCRRKYTVSLQAETYASAVKTFKEMQFGSFNHQTQTMIPATPCGNCAGPREVNGIESSQYHKPFKPLVVKTQDGRKWRDIKQGEYRPTKEQQTLRALQNNTFDFQANFDPNVEHIQQCQCSTCRERSDQAIQEKIDLNEAYNQALKRCGLV